MTCEICKNATAGFCGNCHETVYKEDHNFHSTCPQCNKLIPNQHYECERKHLTKTLDDWIDYPMGVSKWKEIGEKYGYWDFFKKKIIDEIRDKMPASSLVTSKTQLEDTYWIRGGNEIIREVNKILENI